MKWCTRDAWQNMNTQLRLNHTRAGSNKHGKSAKDISFRDLVKLTTCQEFNIRKQCLEHDNNMLQELIMANKGMEWIYSKHRTKVPYCHKPKRIRRYDGTHVNIASFLNRFKHGRNIIMKACWWGWTTHHRAINGMARQPTVRRHVCEAKHGKRKFIGCMDH